MSLAYTYYITNRITSQYYYGSRYSHIQHNRTPSEDLWIHYFTSSKYVKQLINEHGADSFDINIIMVDEDYDKCYHYEQQMIAEHIGNELCLNRRYNTENKFSMAGTHMSDETKAKLRIAKTGKPSGTKGMTRTDATKAIMSASRKGKTAHNKGKKHSPEAIAKMSASHKKRK